MNIYNAMEWSFVAGAAVPYQTLLADGDLSKHSIPYESTPFDMATVCKVFAKLVISQATTARQRRNNLPVCIGWILGGWSRETCLGNLIKHLRLVCAYFGATPGDRPA